MPSEPPSRLGPSRHAGQRAGDRAGRWKARSPGLSRSCWFIRNQTGRTPNAIKNALRATPDPLRAKRLAAACGNDDALARRVLPWAGLVRDDGYGFPWSSLRAASTSLRGPSGAVGHPLHPRILTEPIVQHTLEPLVYIGPAEGLPRERWQLRSPAEILALKVCDKAVGSGAFLVQADRYLAERLFEAWEQVENGRVEQWRWRDGRKGQGTGRRILITAEGERTDDPNKAIPADPDDRMILARRLVAERCLYGVDKNPLAVEMAKLSLWLVTMAKDRPFDYLDHALKCGDSLVGVDEEQFLRWSQTLKGTIGPLYFEENQERWPWRGRNVSSYARLWSTTCVMPRKRRGCWPRPRLPWPRQTRLRPAGGRGPDRGAERRRAGELAGRAADRAHRQGDADQRQGPARAGRGPKHNAFHWFLEFPEVFEREAQRPIRASMPSSATHPSSAENASEILGDEYREALLRMYPGSKGNGDYCAFFFCRAFENLRRGGKLGLIATNTIAQGDTRRMGLDAIVRGEASY